MIYKEISYAEKMLQKNKFLSTKIQLELKLLAKYFVYKGYDKKTIKFKLYEFGERAIKNFPRELYFNIINNAIKYANNTKNRIRELNFIEIYDCEYNFIESLEISVQDKKILFTILCIKKIYDYMFDLNNLYIRSYNRFSDIKKFSGIQNKNIVYDSLFRLNDMNIIRKSKDYSFELLFLKNIDYKNKELKFTIYEPSFEICGDVFDRYFLNDKNTFICICGKVTKQKNRGRPQKYCETCSYQRSLANQRKYDTKKSYLKKIEKYVVGQ